jgi:hypothetical protein
MDTNRIETLIARLQDGDLQTRRLASDELRLANDPLAVAPLIRAYGDVDGAVRENVVYALRNIGSKEALDFLSSKGLPLKNDRMAMPAAMAATVATLIGVWLPAIQMDRASGGGAGATLLAMFLFTPAALGVGWLIALLGRSAGRTIQGLLGIKSPLWLAEIVGATAAGLVCGVLPWLLLTSYCSIAPRFNIGQC